MCAYVFYSLKFLVFISFINFQNWPWCQLSVSWQANCIGFDGQSVSLGKKCYLQQN